MLDVTLGIGLVLSGLLLAFTAYAAIYGLVGSLTGRSYERCPRCHEHFLADGTGNTGHVCDPGPQEIAVHPFHLLASHLRHAHLRHAHLGRG